MPRVPHKKIIQSACHVSENAQSADLVGILKKNKITRTKSDIKHSQEGKAKVTYITGGKSLSTLIYYIFIGHKTFSHGLC